MARYAIDAPTLLHVLRSDRPLDTSHQLVAPNALRSQVLQLLLDEVTDGATTEKEALDLHERVTEVKIRLLGDRVSRRTAWKIAREHGWPTLAHAEHLAVATLQAHALVTIDPDLRAAADGVVPLADVDALTG